MVKELRFVTDGRELIIQDNVGVERSIITFIKNVWKSNNLFHRLPHLSVILEYGKNPGIMEGRPSELRRTMGFIRPLDIIKGENKIHININYYTPTTKEKLNSLNKTLIEEFIHILQFYNKAIQRYSLEHPSKLRTSSLMEDVHTRTKDIRIYLSEFLENLYVEGIAQYSKAFLNGEISFNFYTRSEFYRKAKIELDILLKIYNKFIDNILENNFDGISDEEIKDFIYFLPKNLGAYLTFVILDKNHNISIFDLLKLSIYDFIRLYENSVKRPLISLNSRKGRIDYNELLNIWYKASNEGKEKINDPLSLIISLRKNVKMVVNVLKVIKPHFYSFIEDLYSELNNTKEYRKKKEIEERINVLIGCYDEIDKVILEFDIFLNQSKEESSKNRVTNLRITVNYYKNYFVKIENLVDGKLKTNIRILLNVFNNIILRCNKFIKERINK